MITHLPLQQRSRIYECMVWTVINVLFIQSCHTTLFSELLTASFNNHRLPDENEESSAPCVQLGWLHVKRRGKFGHTGAYFLDVYKGKSKNPSISCHHVCLSLCFHIPIRELPNRFSWNLAFESFLEICRSILISIQVDQIFRYIYTNCLLIRHCTL